MKKIIYLMAAFCAIYLNACSYDDKSTLLDHPAPDIKIDTTGIPQQFSVLLGEELVIEPTVTYDSNPERDFSYEWRLGLTTSNSTDQFRQEYKVLGTEEKLSFVIDGTPKAEPYQLCLRVLDNKNKQLKVIIWLVYISIEITQGLLVADSNDGVTSELSLIQDTIWTNDFRRSASKPVPDPMRIKHNLYALTNGSRYNGIIKKLLFQRKRHNGVTDVEFVQGYTGSRIFQLFVIDFSTHLEDRDLFYDPDVVIDVRDLFHGENRTGGTGYSTSELSVIWNNRSFQRLNYPIASEHPSTVFRYGMYFNGSWGWAMQSSGNTPRYDPNPIMSHGSNLMFYDNLNERFLYATALITETTNMSECTQTEGQPFDPRNVKDVEILHAQQSSNNDHCFVVKQNGTYKILTLLASNGSARAVIDINDAPNIDKATHFIICYNQPVLYYAADNEIYSVLFVDGLGNTVIYNKVWSNPDPINGLYYLQSTTSSAHTYSRTAITVTTTASQTEGKIWVLPFGTLGTGALDESKFLTYTGFNRISAIQVIGGR